MHSLGAVCTQLRGLEPRAPAEHVMVLAGVTMYVTASHARHLRASASLLERVTPLKDRAFGASLLRVPRVLMGRATVLGAAAIPALLGAVLVLCVTHLLVTA